MRPGTDSPRNVLALVNFPKRWLVSDWMENGCSKRRQYSAFTYLTTCKPSKTDLVRRTAIELEIECGTSIGSEARITPV